ncbi:MAG: EamA family transporter [Phycisphaerales bacterium]|nr:EamA family transporter [Phycisphaerales bacterium]
MMQIPSWLVYAVLSAVAASLVGIFGKIGMAQVDSTLATGIRSIIMTLFLMAVCGMAGVWSKIHTVSGRSLLMIVLSGLAGAISWLFYFRAIQLGPVSQVAPIDKLSMPLTVILAILLLRERPGMWNMVGVAMIVAGAYLASLPART